MGSAAAIVLKNYRGGKIAFVCAGSRQRARLVGCRSPQTCSRHTPQLPGNDLVLHGRLFDTDHRLNSRSSAASWRVWASGQCNSSREPPAFSSTLHRCRRRSARRHAGGHETARPGWRRRRGADALKPCLPASRMRAAARDRAHRNVVRPGPCLGRLSRGPIRHHLLQAALHLLSIHAHLVRLVEYRNTRFAASSLRGKMGWRNVYLAAPAPKASRSSRAAHRAGTARAALYAP